ncbi:MAG: MFS transporter [Opitutaceae bacterium]|nr:MFS transporter [Opitutaceae bacterium]
MTGEEEANQEAGLASPAGTAAPRGGGVTVRVLGALALSHGINDALQALLPAVYPLLKSSYGLTFAQVGMITFAFQVSGSLLQPVIGNFTDRRPLPFSLALGMGVTLGGLMLLALAASYGAIVTAAAMVGTGSAIFHPEASRLARLASGGRHGFAQSVFQVGGNLGSALGPVLAAAVVMSRGQGHLAWFSLLALAGIGVLGCVGVWYRRHLAEIRRRAPGTPVRPPNPYPPGHTAFALGVLGVLVFSKFFYTTSLSSFYTFYLMHRFGVSAQEAQYYLAVYLGAFAVGTFAGGPAGDRWGRKLVIWISILGAAPFTLALPHVPSLAGVVVLTVVIGLVLASAFSAILVFAQELMPGRVGLVAGLFFGFAFGMAGIGSAVLGRLADHTSLDFVFHLCAWLPLIGAFTVLLPDVEGRRARTAG